MRAAIPRQPQQRCGRTRCPDRSTLRRLRATVALISILELCWPVNARACPGLTVVNALPRSSVCPLGNSVSVFSPGQQVILPEGNSLDVSGDFSKFPGLGIQVNNWYWTVVSLPVQKGDPQNPDNSGAQFAISDQCVLSHQPAWYGKGIPTYLIATVTAEKTSAGCKITIARNNYTDAVTPSCCAPPGIGSSTCAGPWGITNNHVGEPWPPR
jgi:hypothetical protein